MPETDDINERDHTFMKACLELAQKAEGRTAPNPMVGAIVVDANGVIVGRGFHKTAGTAHAEVYALEQAAERARGATLYVTLEPCCHFGKTPPCSDLVTSSGVKRVVAAMVDPNPKVAGEGLKQIENAGIEVRVGVHEAESEWLNRGFLKRIRTGLPWVCLKMAVTLDGRIADRDGTSRYITGPASRTRVHELRNKFDSVLVGANTLLADDPELTVRDLSGSVRNPMRVAIDTHLRTAPSSRFCATHANTRTLLITSQAAPEQSFAAYPSYIEVVPIETKDGQINLVSALKFLAQQGVNTVLCEGGGRLAGSLVAEGLVDELFWVVAPKLIGDIESKAGFHLDSKVLLPEAWQLKNTSVENLGEDFWIHGVF